jgi:protoporphyrinogen IX oxidase
MLVFHVFGVIFWLGSLLLISSMMTLVPEEIGVAKERLVVNARRLFRVSSNIGAGVAIIFGILIILEEPLVLERGWLHVKILLVLALLAVHVRLYMRIVALEDDPACATRREFSIIHGVVSALLLMILVLVILKPF